MKLCSTNIDPNRNVSICEIHCCVDFQFGQIIYRTCLSINKINENKSIVILFCCANIICGFFELLQQAAMVYFGIRSNVEFVNMYRC